MIVGLSQRVDTVKSYGERRDGVDQRWYGLLDQLGCSTVNIPNDRVENVTAILDRLKPDAIFLSGGNSLSKLDPHADDAAPERDLAEEAILDYGIDVDIPVIGICRGMQFMNLYFGGDLRPVQGHVATRHGVEVVDDLFSGVSPTVNSYHNWGIHKDDLASGLKATVLDADGMVEGIQHNTHKIYGVMWHPERETPYALSDIALLERFLR